MTRIALLQMNSGIDPEANLSAILDSVAQAAQGGAEMLFTPEMSVLLDRDRTRAAPHVLPEKDHAALEAIGKAAREHGIWVALGSLAVESEAQDANGRWANRSIIFDAEGRIAGRYDKMHMFDVTLDDGESWRESNAYRPGDRIVTVDCPLGRLGLAICYDIRFPALFEALGREECDAIAIPAAFTRPTGRDHWHVLQRARAIENSAFVIAAAQVGEHEDGRKTYGHSLVVDPWGEVVLDMGGKEPGIGFVDLDPQRIERVRRQVPSLANRREIPKSLTQ